MCIRDSTYQEYQQELAEPQARSAHHRFSGSAKPGWQQWLKSTHSASTCCQHSQSALKQSNASVVSMLNQRWNSATLLLSALLVSTETVQRFCCQHSRSALKQCNASVVSTRSALKHCNASVVSTLNQLCPMKQCNTSRLYKLSASPTSYGPVQHFSSYIRVCTDCPLQNFSPRLQTLKTTWKKIQIKTKFHRILAYSPFRFLFSCWINVHSTLYTSDYGSHWISSQRII